MKEADRRGSSCPVLFAWDGHKYSFVTDVIGAAVVGHWFTPTRRNIPNPGEWIKVDGDQLAIVNGKLSLRFIEPMEEVNYIDQLRLVAVDHPENVEVNPDERFLDDPPFASGRVVASARRAPARRRVGWRRPRCARHVKPARSSIRQRIHAARPTTASPICTRSRSTWARSTRNPRCGC